MSDASVSTWIGQLRQGDDTAAQRLFQRYVERLVRLATDRLRDRPKRRADEEDLVLSVFEEFVSRARLGKFPKLKDREDLWQILLLITDRRAIDQLRREAAYDKRVRGESTLATPDASTSNASPLEHVADREPTPDEAVAFADELAALLAQLKDDEFRSIVGDRLAGLTDNEIAQKRRCSLRTVERRLSEIRKRWNGIAPQGQIEAI
jgi:RNA polymerase sigma factor (sigma-70 family)